MYALKILLIDDHKLFALSIQIILQQYEKIENVDIISNVQELTNVNIDYYDIFLIDINLTNMSEETGLELAEKLINQYKDICIVILTGHLKLMYEEIASTIGARGFIDKNIEPEELYNILKFVDNDGKYFKNMQSEDIIYEKLTVSEIKILNLLRIGKSINEITEQVFISRRTVFNHLNNIYSKLYVNNKQEAIYKAEQLGYFFEF